MLIAPAANNESFDDLWRTARENLLDLDEVAGLVLLCYFAGFRGQKRVNHVLLEGIQGLSKTRLCGQVNAALLGPELADYYRANKLDPYQRTAGTPDLTAADLIGGDVIGLDARGQRRLVFQPGPLLRPCVVYYADELNRAPPKTQAALLEAMQERQVTTITLDPDWAGRRIRRVPWFFLVASQNPDFQEGTFALPEALLDRFMVRLGMPYTEQVGKMTLEGVDDLSPEEKLFPPAAVRPPAAGGRPAEQADEEVGLLQARGEVLAEWRASAGAAEYTPAVADHVARLVYATWSAEAARAMAPGLERHVSRRPEVAKLVDGVAQGSSPRGALALRDLACALAWAEDAECPVVTPDHVDRLAPHVLGHRLALRFRPGGGGDSAADLVRRLVQLLR